MDPAGPRPVQLRYKTGLSKTARERWIVGDGTGVLSSRVGACATASESLMFSFNALPRAVIDKPQVPQMPKGREKTGLQPIGNP